MSIFKNLDNREFEPEDNTLHDGDSGAYDDNHLNSEEYCPGPFSGDLSLAYVPTSIRPKPKFQAYVSRVVAFAKNISKNLSDKFRGEDR